MYIVLFTLQDIADPFYAYCKLHADKITSRAKRRNYLAIQSHVRQHANNTDINDEKEKVEQWTDINSLDKTNLHTYLCTCSHHWYSYQHCFLYFSNYF